MCILYSENYMYILYLILSILHQILSCKNLNIIYIHVLIRKVKIFLLVLQVYQIVWYFVIVYICKLGSYIFSNLCTGVAPPSFVAIQTGQTLLQLTSTSGTWSWTSVILLAAFAVLSLVPVFLKNNLRSKFDQELIVLDESQSFAVDKSSIISQLVFVKVNTTNEMIMLKIKARVELLHNIYVVRKFTPVLD